MLGASKIRVDFLERRLDRAIDRIEEVHSGNREQSCEIRELKWELRAETRRAVDEVRKELLAIVRNKDR